MTKNTQSFNYADIKLAETVRANMIAAGVECSITYTKTGATLYWKGV